MGRRLSYRQKAANKRKYAAIRKAWEGSEAASQRLTYKQFKHRVQAVKGVRDVKQAIKKVLGSETFVPYNIRAKANLLDTIRDRFPETYKQMRSLMRNEKGQFTNMLDSLSYDNDLGVYTFQDQAGNTYEVLLDSSPEDIYIGRM